MDLHKILYLPPVGSSHGHEIEMIFYLVHILMFVLFLGWAIYFIVALVKFNKWANPKANYHGTHSHISSYIEIGVAVIEVILLLGFSIPFWSRQVDAMPNRPDTVEVRVVAEQFAWNVHYPGKDGIFGKVDYQYYDKQSNPLGLDPNDPMSKDDIITINQFKIPIGRPVLIHLSSKDVIHSFGLPIMRVKQDAIPGMTIPVWFTPTMTGNFEIACAQLCGLGHYRMKGFLTVLKPEEFDAWINEQSAQSAESGGDSDNFWQ